MQELDIATITKRSIHGVLALVSRTFLIQLIGQIVTFLLTVYLSPSDYGIFFLVSTVIVFFSYFSDIGLAAALIQKKEAITTEDLRTTFTIQQTLVFIVIIIGFLLTDTIRILYDLDSKGVFLYYSLLIAFFLSSLKTIPSILLERQLDFKKLVIPEIVETLLFNMTILVLAIKGFGVTSFAVAVLARGFAGTIAMYIIKPWAVSFGFSRTVAKGLLSFGVPFQANSLLALVKDQLLVLYLGTVLTKPMLGYIGFAQKWSFMPLRLVMDNIIRITFPAFSRMSDEKAHLGKAIEKSIFAVVFFIFPVTAGMVLLMPYLFQLIPQYQKWEPAMLSLLFFGINAALSSISTPLTNALNAIGKIKITLYLMVFWTVSTWVLTPLFIFLLGFTGVSVASALIASSVILVVWLTGRYIPLKLSGTVLRPLIATIVMGALVWSISPFIIHSIYTFLLVILIGGMLYVGVMLLLARKQLIADIAMVRLQLRS
ncbi:MAG: oligosaccharide flippase family protein [Candidatus Levybacteria bacterium]|nr:oligosaccharide flippase family protein [Candidatus Levybacteria bacterium]